VAAHLSAGVDLAELGELIDPVTMTPGLLPITRDDGEGLVAEVLWVDHFGNAQLNVDPDEIEAFGDRVALRWGEQRRTARRARTYGDLMPGEIGLVIDSYGLVSIAFDRRSAADELGLRSGDTVRLGEAV
jgi:S-adenosylmethionine hydrolase